MTYPQPTTTVFPGITTTRIAGTGDTGTTDTTGAALSASFANIMGVALSNDQNTLYVLEGFNTNAPAMATCYIRKVTNIRTPSASTVTGVWATIPNTYYSVSCGQIIFGPVSGKVYVTVQTAPLDGAEVGYCNIGYFNPDGSWGGLILESDVLAMGGFSFRADETAVYYSWTNDQQLSNFGDIKVGRKVFGFPQDNDYTQADTYIFPGGFFLSPNGAFQGASGIWFDSASGYLYVNSTGEFSTGVNRIKVEPAVDPSTVGIDLIRTPESGPSGFQTAYRGLIGGPLLWPTGAPYVATIDSIYPNLYVGDPATGASVTLQLPVADYSGGSGPAGETYGGGYLAVGNGRIYYHTPGAIYDLYLGTGWVGTLPLDGGSVWATSQPTDSTS